MNNNFSYEVKKILKNAEKECMSLNHPYVGTEHLLLSLLKCASVSEITKKYNLTYEILKNELINVVGKASKKSEVILYTPLLRQVIDDATREKKISEKEILGILLTSDDGIALRLLLGLDIDIDGLYKELTSDDYCELNEIGEKLVGTNKLIGRDKEINSIIEILLRKNKNNPILIGEAGVGKSAIVEELARRIDASLVPEKLKGKKIISVDMASMLSNTKYRGEFETRLNNIIKEIKKSKNIILFIDEIHTIVKTGGGEGSIDAANILKPYLANDKIKIIGATTTMEYEKFIAPDKALSRRFQSVMVSEPTESETIQILLGVKTSYEAYHNVKISDDNIKNIVHIANKYMYTNHNPDKSLDLLDTVLSRVNINCSNEFLSSQEDLYLKNKDYKNAYLTKKKTMKKVSVNLSDIETTVESMTGIKIITLDEALKINHDIKERFGFSELEEVLKDISEARRTSTFTLLGENKENKKELVDFLVARLKYNYLELDMKDFISDTSINRIIGSDPGYIGYNDTNIISKIKYKPYTLIYLKNIEAASPKVISLFKSIIDKSYIYDNKGDKVVFNSSLLIFDKKKKEVCVGYNKNDESLLDNELDTDKIKTKA